jgi:predicted RNA binding protein YcfA (HicA-like mRNA interferase family)
MGQRKYPPLQPREIEEILIARGFVFKKSKGDHKYYVHNVNGRTYIAQIDMGNPVYNDKWIKLVIKEAGMTREQFYSATKSTARKVGLHWSEEEEL